MADFKALAKDTAIYGLSSIVGRFLNYLLVPLYTYKISAASGGYGVVTNVYAYVALLFVLLTYGMETTFFRFANKEDEDPKKVFSTALWTLLGTSLGFFALVMLFISPISGAMGYAEHPSYIWTMALTVAIDAFQAILFSYLRYCKKAIKFAALKLLFIFMNIGINLLFFVVLPAWYNSSPDVAGLVYNPSIGVGYVFYINLFCTAFITLFFVREMRAFADGFDKALLRRMLSYSWPILLLGLAGIFNQTADKILYPLVCPGEEGRVQLGIYGAVVKIAMIMAMITQAFRYAYEPFVFGNSRDKDSKEMYAKGMKFFIIFTLLAFLAVMAYMDILRFMIGSDYWPGLGVVPIVMAAEIMMGVYFNLSFWYKLTDKTIWGAVFSGAGCIVLVAINVIFIPKYGYYACAWAGFAGYAVAMLLSYFVGQRHFPVAYPLKEIAVYVLLAGVFFGGIMISGHYLPVAARLAVNTLLLLLFAAFILRKEFSGRIPLLRKK